MFPEVLLVGHLLCSDPRTNSPRTRSSFPPPGLWDPGNFCIPSGFTATWPSLGTPAPGHSPPRLPLLTTLSEITFSGTHRLASPLIAASPAQGPVRQMGPMGSCRGVWGGGPPSGERPGQDAPTHWPLSAHGRVCTGDVCSVGRLAKRRCPKVLSGCTTSTCEARPDGIWVQTPNPVFLPFTPSCPRLCLSVLFSVF